MEISRADPNSDLFKVLKYYVNTESLPQSHRNDVELQLIQDRCNSLFSKDYLISLIDNISLCPSYPLQIVLFEGYLDWEALKDFVDNEGPVSEGTGVNIVSDQMEHSKNCRVRQRFPVPVICLGKKLISRSGGLVEKAEMMSYHIRKAKHPTDLIKHKMPSKTVSRNLDTEWLSILKVHHIIDFMNETTKSMFGIVPLCSGEVESSFHNMFLHNAMPFPGVESYKGFRALSEEGTLPYLRSRNEKNKFQADLKVSSDFPPLQNSDYRNWNIVTLTQNYLLYLFHLLRKPEEKGILLHCISGWDRTPLWIGIIRILLWAEGLIHRSLDADQMTYLVVAYDWLLFGHQLAKRLKEHSEIMYCAFWLLQHLTDDLYSFSNTKIPQQFQPERNKTYFQDRPRKVALKRTRRSTSASNFLKKHHHHHPYHPDHPARPKPSYNASPKIIGQLKESASSSSAPDFDSLPVINDPDNEVDGEYPNDELLQTKELSERKKKIIEVWEKFKTVYQQVIDSH